MSKDPHWAEGEAIIKAKASYYAGGALPDSEVDWNVTSAVGMWKLIIFY